ncbi:TetR family transcriptional regulator [Limnobacter thiooxidans]|uniref:TetR/AcrR family transcriptional regulator n=1 Tax=Limnobacter thiooxidans TaxID=131080 RepID=A0AA86MIV8_9BURK|nr:TetR family transcriptional regulator [Limnobacter thiooxidans]BET26727.1 TetR/AcrR family transcriptional regulator [Limnobacter thiooxidans]
MIKTPTRAYGGVTADQRAAERKARLLEAALELFSRQGYARTTIEALCGEAKVTARHFYQLFDSREALLRALYDNIIADLRAGVLQAMSAPKLSLSQQIPLGVSAMVNHYLADSRLARVGVLEVVGVSPQMEIRRREAVHDMAGLIEAYLGSLVAQGDLPKRNYHLVSVALVGGINELLAEWLTLENPPDIPTLSEEIIHILNALIRGAAQ